MLEIYEISIVIAAKNHNPTVLNPDFLKSNDIVPPGYEIFGDPLCAYPVAQVQYKNGISIVAQLDKLVFRENLNNKNYTNAEIPTIAKKYINVLKHVDYTAIGINPKGYISIETPENFVLNKFIASGLWKAKHSGLSKAKISFSYPKKSGNLTMEIYDDRLEVPNKETIDAVFFTSNFHHDIVGGNTKEKVNLSKKILTSWKKDVADFFSLINETYLKEDT